MQKKILIVDDFKDYVSLLEKGLRSEGYQTVALQDSASAFAKIVSEKPDLVLLDIMMPGLAGPEVRAQLVNEPSTKNIPIIFLTGLRAPHTAKKPFIDGVKVVGKAKDFNELLEAIREVLGKSSKN